MFVEEGEGASLAPGSARTGARHARESATGYASRGSLIPPEFEGGSPRNGASGPASGRSTHHTATARRRHTTRRRVNNIVRTMWTRRIRSTQIVAAIASVSSSVSISSPNVATAFVRPRTPHAFGGLSTCRGPATRRQMSFFGGPDEGGVQRIDKSAMKVKQLRRNARRPITQISHHVARIIATACCHIVVLNY